MENEYLYMHLGFKKVVVCMPDTTAYGNLITAHLVGSQVAKERGAAFCMITPNNLPNRAIPLLKSRSIEIVNGWFWQGLAKGLWRAYAVWKDLKSFLARISGISRPIGTQAAIYFGMNFRKLYVDDPVEVHLPPDWEDVARSQAERLNLNESTPVVTVHVRERGFKGLRNLRENSESERRSARIETYHKAIDALVGKGFTVVRIGDRTMTEVSRPGVIDLATSPARTDLLELWCLKRSTFFLASDSGPYWASVLLGVPCLMANATNLVGMYPLRRTDMYVPKLAQDMRSKRIFSLTEMLSHDYLRKFRHSPFCGYIDNNADELLAAVDEMLVLLNRHVQPTRTQLEYKGLLSSYMETPRARNKFAAKTGIEKPYIGDGWISPSFAERYFRPSQMAVL